MPWAFTDCGVSVGRWLLPVPQPCLPNLGFIGLAWPAAVEPIDATARHEVAAKFAEALTRDYAYADKGAATAAAIRAKLEADAYEQIESPEAGRAVAGGRNRSFLSSERH
jgi:hypothetical protein